MNYDEASDRQINIYVAIACGHSPGHCSRRGDILVMNKPFDPCNNPSDAWPILKENSIDFEWLGDLAEASNTNGVFIHEGTRDQALRSCMIVFLKMKAAENG